MIDKTLIYAWDDHYLGIFPANTYSTGSRAGVTLCVSLDGKNIEARTANNNMLASPYFVISRDLPVEITTQSPTLIINYFPLSLVCFSLLDFVGDAGIRPINLNFDANDEWVKQLQTKDIKENTLQRAIMNLIFSIDGYSPIRKNIDLRVLHVAKQIRYALPETNSIEQYSYDIGLSPDRLSHLFKDNMGYSIKSYTLFEKARKALFLTVTGTSHTEASIEAGFSDAAHFSNTIKKFYGLTLSNISHGMDVKIFN